MHLVEYSERFALPRVARSLTKSSESSEGYRWKRLGIIDESMENSRLSRRDSSRYSLAECSKSDQRSRRELREYREPSVLLPRFSLLGDLPTRLPIKRSRLLLSTWTHHPHRVNSLGLLRKHSRKQIVRLQTIMIILPSNNCIDSSSLSVGPVLLEV